MKEILNIALVAHDSRKNELLDWVRFNADLLSKHHLYATGTTGRLISELASLYNIAFATNRTTADMLLTSTLLGDESYTRIVPECIQHYANRKL